jgi:prolyl 4-hydroxylase
VTLASALADLRAGSRESVALAVAGLFAAAETGDGEGYRHLATLAGLGVGMPQSWPRALDLLRRGAAAGSPSAQGQLEVLSTVSGAEITIEDWLTPCAKHVLNESPRTVAVKGFLSLEASRWLIGLADGKLRRARTYGADGRPAFAGAARGNSAFELDIVDTDLVVLLTRQRIASAIGVPVQALETSQILHYRPGQQFAPHYDYLDPALPDVRVNGQRIVTFLIYLNDDFRDGETAFPRLGLQHRGAAGDALYFANLDRAGLPDPQTLHAGLPPAAGEKWVYSQWVRNRARL